MKAIVVEELGSPEVMKIQEREMPEIADYQVLIRVQAISVNFADIKSRQGQYHGTAATASFTPGLDCAGEIIETGKKVTRFTVGQRVMAFPKEGSYAEYVKADENLTFAVPDQLSIETAAASLTVGITAYNVLKKVARLEKGETVLIHAAAGGIGSIAIQLAKLFGASQVVGTTSTSAKAEMARKFGADYMINHTEEDFTEAVNKATDGKGADVILDTVAGEFFDKSVQCLAPFGRIVSFGHASAVAGNVKTTDLHSSCRSVLGYSTGTYRKKHPEFLHEAAEQITEFLLDEKLEIVISKKFKLAEAAEAHAHMESRKSVGKILLIP